MNRNGFWSFVLLLAGLALAAAGCNSSGGGGSTSNLEGTAATGAPIVGTVTVRDAAGQMRSGDIEADGSYTLDIGGLTAPFVVWAEGEAGGKHVKLFSFVDDAASRANVTPATDMALSMALNMDPEEADFSAGVNLQALASQVETAKAVIEEKIKVVLATLNLSGVDAQNFDIFSTPFEANGQGFDGLLDIVDFKCEGGKAVMEDKSSGTVMYREDLGSGAAEVNLDAGQLQAVAQTIAQSYSNKEDIAQLFETILGLFASGTPSVQQLTAALAPHMASDFYEDGQNLGETLADFATGGDGPRQGMTLVSVSFVRPMGTYKTAGGTVLLKEFDQNNSGYQKGFWTLVTVAWQGFTETYLTSFVYDGSQWKWYGNRNPFEDGGDMDAKANMTVANNAAATFYSGLSFYLKDEPENNSYPLRDGAGVAAVYVMGPGLSGSLSDVAAMNTTAYWGGWNGPQLKTGWGSVTSGLPGGYKLALPEKDDAALTSGLVLVLADDVIDDPHWWDYDQYRIYNEDSINGQTFTDQMGLDVDAIAEGSVYRFVAVKADGSIHAAWVNHMRARPYKQTELAAGLFPALTAVNGAVPAGTTLGSFSLPGSVSFTWTNPTDPLSDAGQKMFPEWAGVNWWGASGGGYQGQDNPVDIDEAGDPFAFTSYAHQVVDNPGTLNNLELSVECEDSAGRFFESRWRFGN